MRNRTIVARLAWSGLLCTAGVVYALTLDHLRIAPDCSSPKSEATQDCAAIATNDEIVEVTASAPLTRAELLVTMIESLATPALLAEIENCAVDGCEGWRWCSETGTGGLHVDRREASFIGWSIAPERGFFRGDGNAKPGTMRTCRPDDPARWVEAVVLLTRLTRTPAPFDRVSIVDIDLAGLDGYRFSNVEQGDQWWIPPAVALNEAGIACMPKTSAGTRTANVCGAERIGDCTIDQIELEHMLARVRGDSPLLDCEAIVGPESGQQSNSRDSRGASAN